MHKSWVCSWNTFYWKLKVFFSHLNIAASTNCIYSERDDSDDTYAVRLIHINWKTFFSLRSMSNHVFRWNAYHSRAHRMSTKCMLLFKKICIYISYGSSCISSSVVRNIQLLNKLLQSIKACEKHITFINNFPNDCTRRKEDKILDWKKRAIEKNSEIELYEMLAQWIYDVCIGNPFIKHEKQNKIYRKSGSTCHSCFFLR